MKRYMERIWELMTDAETKHRVPLYDEATPKGISYEQFRIESGRVYAYLKAHGIGKEDFVMIRLPRGIQPVIAMIGVWRAGAAYVPVEETIAPERAEFIYQDCGCKMTINSQVWEEIIRCEPLDGYEETDLHDAAFAVYTSGTSGKPKGVLHEYGNLERCMESINYQGEPIFYPGERCALAAPIDFVASHICLFYNLYVGYSTTYILSFSTVKNPVALMKSLLMKRVSILFLTPTYARKLAGKTGPFLKRIAIGSEPANNFYLKGITSFNMYAQSESGIITTIFCIDKEYDNCPVGKPQFDMKYRVVDDNGKEVPDGEIGELIFENPYVRGYINLPEETARAFKDGFYYSSDIAQILPDGNIALLGRKSDMIKINGNRIEPAEIEAAIRSILKIDWCAVRGFVSEEQSFVCAYYKDDITFDADAVREQLQKRLPHYMIPAYFMKIDSVPVKSSGKMDRTALPKPEVKDIVRTYREPTNEIETILCKAMETVLQMEHVGVDDDFYELGGDSFSTMEMMLETELPDLDAACIFRGRTAAKIAKLYMAQMQSSGNKALNDAAKLQEHKLTEEQMDMFLYQSQEPNSTMYNLYRMLRFEKKDVDLPRMAKAIETAFKNHPTMGTILQYNEAGELIQKYDPDMDMTITPEYVSEEELEAIKGALLTPFQMLNAPLYRCRLFETEKAIYMAAVLHHIIFDGTSMNIVLNSLFNAYIGAAMDTDYYYLVVDKRREMEQSDFYEESRQYHENKFANTKWTRYPKFDRMTQENKLGTLSCREAISDAHISSVEKKFMVSRNEFYIAATLLALAISTNKKDVHVAWIYNGRDDMTAASSAGMLFRELSVGLRLRSDADLREIFMEVHDQVRDGIKYSCYPYMANIPQNEEGDITCVMYQKNIPIIDQFMGIHVDLVELDHNKLDALSVLDIQIIDGDEGIEYVFDYSASRYEQETMSRFQNLFRQVVAAIVNNANTEDYTFAQLKQDVGGKKDIMQKIKDVFHKK